MPISSDDYHITKLYSAYADGVNRVDVDRWISCWASDAIWQFKGRTVAGIADIRSTWLAAMSAYTKVDFFSQVGHLEIASDKAEAIIYTLEFIEQISGETRTQIGQYDDTLICRDNVWQFSRRIFHIRTSRF